jgi:hypothetical protein
MRIRTPSSPKNFLEDGRYVQQDYWRLLPAVGHDLAGLKAASAAQATGKIDPWYLVSCSMTSISACTGAIHPKSSIAEWIHT